MHLKWVLNVAFKSRLEHVLPLSTTVAESRTFRVAVGTICSVAFPVELVEGIGVFVAVIFFAGAVGVQLLMMLVADTGRIMVANKRKKSENLQ